MSKRGTEELVSAKLIINEQKQPTEEFCEKNCTKKFCRIYRKTPVSQSLFLGIHRPAQVFSCEFCEHFKKNFL